MSARLGYFGVFFSSCTFVACDGDSIDELSFAVRNNSDLLVIARVYATPTTVDVWGSDLLGSDVLAIGDRWAFEVPAPENQCTYDIKLEAWLPLDDAFLPAETQEIRDIDLCVSTEPEIEFGPTDKRSFVVHNGTGDIVWTLYVEGNEGGNTFSLDRLGNEVLFPEERLWIEIDEPDTGQCEFQIRWSPSGEDQDVTYQIENLCDRDYGQVVDLKPPAESASESLVRLEDDAVPADGLPPTQPVSTSTNAADLNVRTAVSKNSSIVGTGFATSDRHLVTNHHVVAECLERNEGTVVVGRFPRTQRELIVAYENDREDLAIFQLSPDDMPFPEHVLVRHPSRSVSLGESAVTFGFPNAGTIMSQSGTASSGIVASLSGFRQDSDRMQITAPVFPGSSGGPLLDNRGSLIGVIVQRSSDAVNFAIKTSQLISTFEAMHLEEDTFEYESIDVSESELSIPEIVETAYSYTYPLTCQSRQ